MAAQIIDFLEAVEIDADDGDMTTVRLGPRKLAAQMVCKAGTVRQTGQSIAERHLPQLLNHILRRLGINKIARNTRADDDETDARDRKGHCGRHAGVGQRGAGCKRRDGQRRHAREVEPRYCKNEEGERHMMRERPRPADGLMECERTKDGRHQDRRGDIGAIPLDETVHVIGQHAGVVHGRNGEAHEGTANLGQARALVLKRDDEAQSATGHHHYKGDRSKKRIECQRCAHVKRKHGNEMRAPDRCAGSDGCEKSPSMALRPEALTCTAEKPESDPASAQANKHSQQHQAQVVLGENAGNNAHINAPQLMQLQAHPKGPQPSFR